MSTRSVHLSDITAAPEQLWGAWVNEARMDRGGGDSHKVRMDRGGGDSHSGDHEAAAAASDAGSVELPFALSEDTARGEIVSQAAYIQELERLLSENLSTSLASAMPAVAQYDASEPSAASAALELRRQNRMLRAKTFALERQLAQAHARGRRAEQLNLRWREQNTLLREREREGWERLQNALQRIEQVEVEEKQRRQREKHRRCQRCAELEDMVYRMRDALAIAQRRLGSDALGI